MALSRAGELLVVPCGGTAACAALTEHRYSGLRLTSLTPSLFSPKTKGSCVAPFIFHALLGYVRYLRRKPQHRGGSSVPLGGSSFGFMH